MTRGPGTVPPWLGGRIKRLRTGRGWSLRDLDRACGLSSSSLSKIEAGNDFTVSSAMVIAEAFGIPLTELLASPACDRCDGKPSAGFMCTDCGRTGTGG